MINYNVDKAVKAVQYLVTDQFYARRVRKLWNTVAKKRSLPFKDDEEPLNELVIVGRQDEKALQALLSLAEYKRTDKNEYQRQFMAAKRKRQALYVEVYEKLNGEKASLEKRREILIRQQEEWDRERDEYVAENSQRYRETYGEDPTWTQTNEMKREYWAIVDARLAKMREEVEYALKPKKRVVTVKETPAKQLTKMQQAFAAIVDRKK